MSDSFFEEEEFESQITGKIFTRILSLARPHRKFLAGFIVAVLFTSIIDAVFTYISKQVVDQGIMKSDPQGVIRYLALYGLLIVIQAISVFFFIYLVGILGERVRYDLRQIMFNHLQDLSLSYYSKTPVGWIMSRVTSDTDRVGNLLTWGILDTTWAIVNILTSLAFMFIIKWQLAMIILIIIPVLAYIAIQFRRHILKEFREVRRMNSKIVGSYNESITGVRVIKALGRESENMKEFGQLTDRMFRSGFRAAWLSALFLPTVQVISAFALGSIAWYGGSQAELGAMTVGGIQAFVSYLMFMIWPIQDVARVFAELQHAIASAERIFSLIDARPEVEDRSGAFDPGSIHGDIQFEHVYFSYETDDAVLEDFNLYVKQGETIALVGPTGGGKSTIVNLLCRFYEPRKGSIYIIGEDYTRYTLHAIQSRIGMVLQTPHLFSGSIRENIRYGRLEASDEDVEKAARVVGAHEFIQGFKKGYDENVGEGGNLLSVGQKQLISLARAVLAEPEIFIMDEATSSVDTLTEALIQKGMETLMKDRTSFIIAHRLSTIKRADRIVVIEHGQIAEMGTHAELLSLRGRYYSLYTRQFRKQIEEAVERIPEETGNGQLFRVQGESNQMGM